jgi:hypothetical protein
MVTRLRLTVNENLIDLNEFLVAYVYHVTAGIVASLKDTGAVKKLKMNVNKTGDVKIDLNGKAVPVNEFVTEIIRNTLGGMVANLKGVEGPMKTFELIIEQ